MPKSRAQARHLTLTSIPSCWRTMQKHGLTMFAVTCYSNLVPRVHPGLLCAAGFSRLCVRTGS